MMSASFLLDILRILITTRIRILTLVFEYDSANNISSQFSAFY